MHPSMPPRRGDGFTIHDVLVALTLIAILAAVSVAPFATWHRRASVRSSAATLRADLARARVEGVLRGETVAVVLDTVADGWRVEAANGAPLLARSLPPGLALTSSAHQGRIPFTSRGTSNLYSTTWIGVADEPGAPWHGARVSPTGAVEPR